MFKKLTILLGLFFLLVSGSVFAEEITVLVNGDPIISDVPAQKLPVYAENGEYTGDRVMLPLRAVGEKLNCDVAWNEENEGVLLYRKNTLCLMWINRNYGFYMEGLGLSKHYCMDVPPTVIQDRTLVPVRATAELLGATVNWIEETNTVTIDYPLDIIEENAGSAEKCIPYSKHLGLHYDNYVAYCNGTLDKVTGRFVLEDDRTISFELYPAFTPKTVERFVRCAKDGFYDNTVFHRVISGFVAQGGGYDKEMQEKDASAYGNLTGEFIKNKYFQIIPHNRGYLSFARPDAYDGANTQFFIVHQDSRFLDGNYAAFGKITQGIELVDEICSAKTDEYDQPITPVILKTVVID